MTSQCTVRQACSSCDVKMHCPLSVFLLWRHSALSVKRVPLVTSQCTFRQTSSFYDVTVHCPSVFFLWCHNAPFVNRVPSVTSQCIVRLAISGVLLAVEVLLQSRRLASFSASRVFEPPLEPSVVECGWLKLDYTGKCGSSYITIWSG